MTPSRNPRKVAAAIPWSLVKMNCVKIIRSRSVAASSSTRTLVHSEERRPCAWLQPRHQLIPAAAIVTALLLAITFFRNLHPRARRHRSNATKAPHPRSFPKPPLPLRPPTLPGWHSPGLRSHRASHRRRPRHPHLALRQAQQHHAPIHLLQKIRKISALVPRRQTTRLPLQSQRRRPNLRNARRQRRSQRTNQR